MKKPVMLFMVVCMVVFLFASVRYFYGDTGVEPYVESLKAGQKGMTMWGLVKTGGLIMLVLGFLSVGALASVIYNGMKLKMEHLVPEPFTEELIEKLQKKEFAAAQDMCKGNSSLISRVTRIGLQRRRKGALAVREAMEILSREAAGRFWQRLSVLADIAGVSPMLGLLGTVVGMIQAFNVIAFQVDVVKPILLAGGVAKAMVTTAGGLIVAIPAMISYSFFRIKLQSLLNIVERQTLDIMNLIIEGERHK